MNYTEFLEYVKGHIMDFLPEEARYAKTSIIKSQQNNDVIWMALTISQIAEGVSPQIYMEIFYHMYECGINIDSILRTIAERYLKCRRNDFVGIGQWIMDYKNVKKKIVLQVVNRDRNISLLPNIPHKNLENTDLSAIYNVYLNTQDNQDAMVCVNNYCLAHWDITDEDLFQTALENTIRIFPAKIESMTEIFEEQYGGIKREEQSGHAGLEDFKMESHMLYVLSNTKKIQGAAVMFYPDVLQRLADNACANLFILPSSIHEILLQKDTADAELSADKLQAIVKDINRHVVEAKEILSDAVYYYDRKRHLLSLAKDRYESK